MTDRILRRPEVEKITGRSRASIYADPKFPKPVKIGLRASGWLESEVAAWMNSKIAARDTAQAA